MNRTLAIAIGALALSTTTAAAGELDLSKGMKELGGSATLDLFTGGGNTQVGLFIQPQGGYFIIDNLELLLAASFQVIGDATGVGFGVGAHYYIPAGSMPAYVGGTLNYGSVSAFGLGNDQVSVSLQGGILPALADNIALDLGLRANVYFGDPAVLHIPAGYLGVRAYFR